MHRRNILAATFAAAGALLAAAGEAARVAGAAAAPAPDAPKADGPKAVYHLSDLDKVAFVLGNIRNHFDGMGGAGKVTLALVVHGPALKAFHGAQARPDVVRGMSEFVKAGLTPIACGNTMRAQSVDVKDLLPGFAVADRGGVVRLAELQAQGYAYLRP